MKIGLVPVNVGVSSVENLAALARKAEAVGVESLWTFEHVIVPIDYQSKYPYSKDGKMGAAPETNFVDPLIALTTIAAHTSRLRLGTGVNILPQANPLYLAKQAASIDFASNGRLMLGLGIGWLEEEFVASGVPFARRGARFDDYVEAMKKMWSGEVVEHASEFLQWSGFKSHPLPVQQIAGRPAVPIVIGGTKGKAFERVAKYGDGWFVPVNQAKHLEPLLEPFADACAKHDRDPKSVEISAMWIPAAGGIDSAKRFADLGVSRLIVPLTALGGPPVDALERFADEVLAKLA